MTKDQRRANEPVYFAALEKASEELKALIQQRTDLDQRILRLQQTITTLFRLVGQDNAIATQNKGLVDAVRDYLGRQEPDDAVTIREIRGSLESVGYDFSRYKNPNASISGTLERLVENGQAMRSKIRTPNGGYVTAYRAPTKDGRPEKAKEE